MTYGSFAHLFLAEPQVLKAIRAEYNDNVYMIDDEVVDPYIDGGTTIAYVILTNSTISVVPVHSTEHDVMVIQLVK